MHYAGSSLRIRYGLVSAHAVEGRFNCPKTHQYRTAAPCTFPFLPVFRVAAFGGGRPGRSSDSVYFRVKFSPGRFAISRRIVRRGQYNHGDGIPTRVGIPELSSVRAARLVGPTTCFRRNFRKFNLDAGARPVTPSVTIPISLSPALSDGLW